MGDLVESIGEFDYRFLDPENSDAINEECCQYYQVDEKATSFLQIPVEALVEYH